MRYPYDGEIVPYPYQKFFLCHAFQARWKTSGVNWKIVVLLNIQVIVRYVLLYYIFWGVFRESHH